MDCPGDERVNFMLCMRPRPHADVCSRRAQRSAMHAHPVPAPSKCDPPTRSPGSAVDRMPVVWKVHGPGAGTSASISAQLRGRYWSGRQQLHWQPLTAGQPADTCACLGGSAAHRTHSRQAVPWPWASVTITIASTEGRCLPREGDRDFAPSHEWQDSPPTHSRACTRLGAPVKAACCNSRCH